MTTEQHADDFAKIVRTSTGRQVLVFASQTDEGNPSADIGICYDGVTMHINAGFKDTDAGYETRDAYIRKFDQVAADGIEGRVRKLTDEATE